MEENNKLKDVVEILSYSKDQISRIKNSISSNNLNKVELKNLLENLRSVLDYIASDISQKINSDNYKIFFPYGEILNHFKKSIARNLPHLNEKLPKTYSYIENMQPFKTGNNWLIDLCKLTNEAKHNQLIQTSEKEVIGLNIPGLINFEDVSNFGEVNINNIEINGKK